MAGAKNRRKIKPDMTEYRTSLLLEKHIMAHSFKLWKIWHISAGHSTALWVIAWNMLWTYEVRFARLLWMTFGSLTRAGSISQGFLSLKTRSMVGRRVLCRYWRPVSFIASSIIFDTKVLPRNIVVASLNRKEKLPISTPPIQLF